MTGVKVRIGGDNSYIHSVVSLAKRVYKPEDVSSIERYYSFFKKSPESFIFAIDPLNNHLKGYIISLPLDFNYFPNTITTEFKEDCLIPEVVRPYQKGANKVYLFSIVIDPSCPNRLETLKALSKAYIQQMRDYALDGVFITEASALALSESGIKICQGINMDLLSINDKGHIFHRREFHKNFIDKDTKEGILKSFVARKRLSQTINKKAT